MVGLFWVSLLVALVVLFGVTGVLDMSYLFEFKLATEAGDNSFDICLPASSLAGYRCGGYNTFFLRVGEIFLSRLLR